jgi:hypothetical protein
MERWNCVLIYVCAAYVQVSGSIDGERSDDDDGDEDYVNSEDDTDVLTDSSMSDNEVCAFSGTNRRDVLCALMLRLMLRLLDVRQ